MKLSEWQLRRIRNALRAYYCYEQPYGGDAFTWKDVSEAIDIYTGTWVPPERLRQFVEGVRQKKGGLKHPVPKPKRLKAILDFVLHPEKELLSEDELTERHLDVQAALRLLEYLDQDFDGKRIIPPRSIAGKYYHWRPEPPFVCVSELVFERPPSTGVVAVRQTERQYEEDQVPDNVAIAIGGLPENYKSQARYVGWAILTPEDNFFLFLKEERVGRNRYYFTLSTNLARSNTMSMTELSFLHHDYPLEFDSNYRPTRELEEPIQDLLNQNHHEFVRI